MYKLDKRRRKKRGPYLIKIYICTKERHIFHSAKPGTLMKCNKCGWPLEVLGEYKSQRPPGISRKKPGGKWILPSEVFYIREQNPVLSQARDHRSPYSTR